MAPRKDPTDVHDMSDHDLLIRIDARTLSHTGRLDTLPCSVHLKRLDAVEKAQDKAAANGKVQRVRTDMFWSAARFILPLLLAGSGGAGLVALLGGK